MKKTFLILIFIAILSSSCLEMFFPPAPSPTPTPSAPPAPRPNSTATSTPPPIAARIHRIDFDKERYNAGDQARPSITVLNTGTSNITSERVIVRATCVKLSDFFANLLLQSKSVEDRSRTWTFDYTETILPKETKVLSAIFNTQAEASGIRLAGDYDIAVTLEVNGKRVDSKTVRITLY